MQIAARDYIIVEQSNVGNAGPLQAVRGRGWAELEMAE
jgi:hypothetical protein